MTYSVYDQKCPVCDTGFMKLDEDSYYSCTASCTTIIYEEDKIIAQGIVFSDNIYWLRTILNNTKPSIEITYYEGLNLHEYVIQNLNILDLNREKREKLIKTYTLLL